MKIWIGLIICYDKLGLIPALLNEKRVGEIKNGGAQVLLWSAGPMFTPIAARKAPEWYKQIRRLNKPDEVCYSGWFKSCAEERRAKG